MLALDENAFDQDLSGGWRMLARLPGCETAAADLIRDYRESRGLTRSILYWHEGQLRAAAGAYGEAVRLFEQSRNPSNEYGWNSYVDASIAFLRGDREGLESARRELAALPRPDGFTKMAADMEAKTGRAPPWPANLDVIDGLVACFGKPYAKAYGGSCRPHQSIAVSPDPSTRNP